MDESAPAAVNEEGIVILPGNWAICPDCLRKVNLGTSGIGNLTVRHKGSKKCEKDRKKRLKKEYIEKTQERARSFFMRRVPEVDSAANNRDASILAPGPLDTSQEQMDASDASDPSKCHATPGTDHDSARMIVLFGKQEDLEPQPMFTDDSYSGAMSVAAPETTVPNPHTLHAADNATQNSAGACQIKFDASNVSGGYLYSSSQIEQLHPNVAKLVTAYNEQVRHLHSKPKSKARYTFSAVTFSEGASTDQTPNATSAAILPLPRIPQSQRDAFDASSGRMTLPLDLLCPASAASTGIYEKSISPFQGKLVSLYPPEGDFTSGASTRTTADVRETSLRAGTENGTRQTQIGLSSHGKPPAEGEARPAEPTKRLNTGFRPYSPPPVKSMVIDVDALPDHPEIKSQSDSASQKKKKPCLGVRIVLPPHISPHSTYPFALHEKLGDLWDYSIKSGNMTLRARKCKDYFVVSEQSKTDGASQVKRCAECQELSESTNVVGIIDRMKNGVKDSSPYVYYGAGDLVGKIRKGKEQVEELKFQVMNDAKKLANRADKSGQMKTSPLTSEPSSTIREWGLTSSSSRGKKRRFEETNENI